MLASYHPDDLLLGVRLLLFPPLLPSQRDDRALVARNGGRQVLPLEVDVGVETGRLFNRVDVVEELGVGVGQVGSHINQIVCILYFVLKA